MTEDKHEEYNNEEVQELFDVVFKLSAKDIKDKLVKVRNRPDIAKRRWFWELLQNAKDSVKRSEQVSVYVAFLKDNESTFLDFSHNGNPFRYQDAKNLIFPYSDKEDEQESDKSGKFGTGFLATHILSKIIFVEGIYLKDEQAFDFEFTLDRSTDDKVELANKISDAWKMFRSQRKVKDNYTYDQKNYETHFIYPLDADKVNEVLESTNDFQLSLPFALAFIPKVKSVCIKSESQSEIRFSNNIALKRTIDEYIEELTIQCTTESGEEITNTKLIVCSDEVMNIAVEIEHVNEVVFIKDFHAHQPKIYCPFPLIGANDFPFPAVVNSETFFPKEERDGIWLGSGTEAKANQALFERCITLYAILLNFASSQNWENLHLLFKSLNEAPKTSDLDQKWFTDSIQTPIKTILLATPLVDNTFNERLAIKGEEDVLFPSDRKAEVRDVLWDILFPIWPKALPKKEAIHKWYEVIWDECPQVTVKSLCEWISSFKNLNELSKQFAKPNAAPTWLNEAVGLIYKEAPDLLNSVETPILPNQFGQFKRKDDLYLDDDTIDDELKVIHSEIGKFKKGITDWRTELLDKRIYLDLPANKTRSIKELSLLIVENTKELLKDENPSNELQDTFSRLLNWLNENPDKRREYFKGLKVDSLLYKTTNEAKLRHFTEILRKDREGSISIEELAKIDGKKLALLSDPDLELKVKLGERVIEEQKKEAEEFEFKRRHGKLFENAFQRLINGDSRFEIKKVEGEEDFIVTNKLTKKTFYIELKSIKIGEAKVEMTHKQAGKANRFPSNYFLCIVPNNGQEIDDNYFMAKAIFDNQIGIKLGDKIAQAAIFEKSKDGISVEFEDELLKQYKKYRYKFSIEKIAWGSDNFSSFKNKLLL
jgi:Domain of unknown function (DUF3883)